jgi:hypothetical protein
MDDGERQHGRKLPKFFGSRQQSKRFFFEKKKQKTFIHWLGVAVGVRRKQLRTKYQKEALPSLTRSWP